MSKAPEKKAAQQQAAEYLRTLFPPGATVSTILLHASRSGMSRSIGVLAVEDGEVRDVSWAVARVLDWRFDRDRGGVKVSGCGMDMGFHLVYALSRTLYPDGFGCIGEAAGYPHSCPSCDHYNGDRDYTPHESAKAGQALALRDSGISWATATSQPGHWHSDGGYALRHRWI